MPTPSHADQPVLTAEEVRQIQAVLLPRRMRRMSAALGAGTPAILANTALLALFDRLGVRTAHGGLLQLLRALARIPTSIHLNAAAFHIVVGLVMALAYAFVIEPRLAGPPLKKGLTFATLLWLANAAIVLPATGQGFAGHLHLAAAGMIGFAIAHTLFFLLLSWLYAELRKPRRFSRS